MNIIFMGTPEFSVPTLEAIIASKHHIQAVITQPDKPKGRGNVMTPPPVKETALKYQIPVLQPIKVREAAFLEEIKAMAPDVIIVIAFGQILSKAFLDIPKYGCINIHASLLPKHRGSAPIQWAVIHGEKTSGITTMMMDAGIDTGDMLLKEEITLADDETGGSLHDRLMVLGGPLVLKTLEHIEAGTLVRTKQEDEKSTYEKMLDKSLGNIDWTKPAIEIERIIRGLNPWPSAYTYLEGKMLKIWKASVLEDTSAEAEAGEVIDMNSQGFVVKCGKGALMIQELQLQGKNRMDAPAFLRGVKLTKGLQLKQI